MVWVPFFAGVAKRVRNRGVTRGGGALGSGSAYGSVGIGGDALSGSVFGSGATSLHVHSGEGRSLTVVLGSGKARRGHGSGGMSRHGDVCMQNIWGEYEVEEVLSGSKGR